jgi:hypothetical protein
MHHSAGFFGTARSRNTNFAHPLPTPWQENKIKNWRLSNQKNRHRVMNMHHTAESIFVVEYLLEYEFIFETALAHESVDPGGIV